MNNSNKYTDENLLAELRENSPQSGQAFDILFNKYSSRLNAYCLFKTDNKLDAEEIFEDTWLKFLDRVRNGKELTEVLPYLYTIARTIIIDKYRRENATKSIGIEYKDINDLDELVNPFEFESELEREELISLIKIAVSELDEIYKDTFVLQWFGGMTQKEIAKILDISIGSVKMRSHRAMSEIIKILKPVMESR
jgi:RNA polymerase sigma-70 factor, ECF subfamily